MGNPQWSGWGPPSTGGTVDADALNLIIPTATVDFDAAVMSEGATLPATFQNKQIDTLDNSFNVFTFNNAVITTVYWKWKFRGIPFDYASPGFKLAPYMFQDSVVAKPAPDEFVRMTLGMGASVESQTLNYSLSTVNNVTSDCLVDAENEVFLAESTGDKAIVYTTLDGTGLSATGWNTLTFALSRTGTDPADTFANPIHLLGCVLQYNVDFNNISAFPT